MELKKDKVVRFHYGGKKDSDIVLPKPDPTRLDKSSSAYKLSSIYFNGGGNLGTSGRIGEPYKFGKSKVLVEEEEESWRKKILDPGSEIVLKWNKVFIVSCLLALFVDPLYFYLPGIGGDSKTQCVKTDLHLQIVVTLWRTVADLFYLLHLIIKFRTAYVAPSSRVFGRGELVRDPKMIARRYIKSDFFIDFVATLPLPQVLGAAWYLLSIERYTHCWKSNCKQEKGPPKCDLHFLDCDVFNRPDRLAWANTTAVFSNCDPKQSFPYGIFKDAVNKNVVSSNFIRKYFYYLSSIYHCEARRVETQAKRY
ncbi:Cyclic nucleotide-gated ion channel 17 [Bienertia sinuspersici]